MSPETRFDPLYTWFGIPSHEQPPDHYRLLGLARFESDATVIRNAVDRYAAFLKAQSSGVHLQDAQHWLNEVVRVKLCLLDPQAKAEYDRTLEPTSESLELHLETGRSSALRRSRKPSRSRFVVLATVIGVVTLGALVLQFAGNFPATRPADRDDPSERVSDSQLVIAVGDAGGEASNDQASAESSTDDVEPESTASELESKAMAQVLPGRGDTTILLSKEEWSVVHVSSRQDGSWAINAFDDEPTTHWHTRFPTRGNKEKPSHPHELVIDLGGMRTIRAFRYLARQRGRMNGAVADCEFYVASSLEDSWQKAASVTFKKVRAWQEVSCEPTVGRYLRILVLSEVNGRHFASIGELDIVGQ